MSIYEQINSIITNDDYQSSSYQRVHKKRIGYTCNFIPPEIIYAAGMTPVKIFHNADVSDVSSGDIYMQRNTCPFVRGCIGKLTNGGFEDLDGIIGAHTCDNMRGMCENLEYFKISPQILYQLDIPRSPERENNINYYTSQIKEMIPILEKISEVKFTHDSLVDAVQLYAQLRKSLQNIYTSLQTKETGLSTRLFFQLLHKMMTVDPGHYIFALKKIESVCNDMEEMTESPKLRIALMGSLLLKDNYKIIDAVESKGAKIIDDFICSGSRYLGQNINLSPNGDAIFSIAKTYLQATACPRMYNDSSKEKRLLELLNPKNIDGVIFYVLKFCDSALYESAHIKNLCDNADIAFLNIESELTEQDQGQINTRVAAFFENIYH